MTVHEIICWGEKKKKKKKEPSCTSKLQQSCCFTTDNVKIYLQPPAVTVTPVGRHQTTMYSYTNPFQLLLLFPRRSSLRTQGLQHWRSSCCSQWEFSVSVGAKQESSGSPWKSWPCTGTSPSLWYHLTPLWLTATFQQKSQAASPTLIQFTYREHHSYDSTEHI